MPGRVGIALLALALLVSPAGAGAKKKGKKKPGPVVTMTGTAAPAAGVAGTASATCPNGTELLGGGHAASPFFTNGSNFVYESRRTGTRTWTVSSHNASLSAGTLTAEAYCRKGAPRLSEATSSMTLPGSGIGGFPDGQASANCPSGQKAVAGGFFAAIAAGVGYSGAFIFASTTSAPGTWTVSAMNTATDPHAFSSYAYCTKAQRPGVTSPIVDVTGAGTPVQANTPACPKVKGKKKKGSKKKPKKKPTSALAGGFITPKPDVALGPGSSHGVFNFESRRSGATWRASGNSIGTEPGASRLQATAYCG